MELKKQLTLLDVFCIASGAMISSGIFILPGLAFSYAGPAVFISYLLAGVLALVGVLSVIELSTAMPKAGGDYYFVTRSLGPLVGTVSGIMSWFALSLKTAFAVFGIAEIVFLLTGTPVLLTAAIVCVAFAILNSVGVEAAAKLEVYLVIGLLAILATYCFAGMPQVKVAHFHPFIPQGTNSVLSTAFRSRMNRSSSILPIIGSSIERKVRIMLFGRNFGSKTIPTEGSFVSGRAPPPT